ncbi:hypothetical protein AB6E47_004722 [Salmonella enterica]
MRDQRTLRLSFRDPVDEISGDIFIDSGKLPPEMKQTILLLVKKAADHDAAEKALSDIMKQIEFDVTAAELAAYLFKPGHA